MSAAFQKNKAQRDHVFLRFFVWDFWDIINTIMIDTHAHLQFPDFQDDLEAVLARNRQKNITCINVGTDFASSKAAVEMAQMHGGLWAAIGLHPTDVDEDLDVEKYRALAQSRKVVAIGEIGLDYLRSPLKEKQKSIFLEQADLAKELELPLIIHCRMAHEDMLAILKEKGERETLKGVIHCFTGTLEEAQKYIDLGFYLGMNGIMFKFNLDEVIKNVSLEHLLLETDCPYLTPPAAPSKRNEPIFMEYTARKIANLKNISAEEVVKKTTQNARNLFKL
ncbi:MAG TPA: TatD family hydrolase [Negativicutes bacterium]|nr:TatD family hydrolase [Negativicutes bacterium]